MILLFVFLGLALIPIVGKWWLVLVVGFASLTALARWADREGSR